MGRENPQAYGEEVTTCEIPHPPSTSLPNEISIVNHLGDEECL